MESTVFGCPAQPKQGPEDLHPLAGIDRFDLGVTFSDGGLRGRIQFDWSKAP
jgi:hypothetical protein